MIQSEQEHYPIPEYLLLPHCDLYAKPFGVYGMVPPGIQSWNVASISVKYWALVVVLYSSTYKKIKNSFNMFIWLSKLGVHFNDDWVITWRKYFLKNSIIFLVIALCNFLHWKNVIKISLSTRHATDEIYFNLLASVCISLLSVHYGLCSPCPVISIGVYFIWWQVFSIFKTFQQIQQIKVIQQIYQLQTWSADRG